MPPAGWRVANGSLITSASIVVPVLVAALKSTESWRLVSEAEWQAQSASDPWNGIGGVKNLVLDLSADTVRLPDIRGMYMEAAGFNGLTAGGVHGDAIRNIIGWAGNSHSFLDASGAISISARMIMGYHDSGSRDNARAAIDLNVGKVVPTSVANMPRAFGVLGCVYVGMPAA